MAATFRGAPVDGVNAVAPAHHGQVKDMRDVTVARSEWQQIVRGIKPGPRLVVINRGRRVRRRRPHGDTRAAFATSGVQALVIADPQGFKGHDAGYDFALPRK